MFSVYCEVVKNQIWHPEYFFVERSIIYKSLIGDAAGNTFEENTSVFLLIQCANCCQQWQ